MQNTQISSTSTAQANLSNSLDATRPCLIRSADVPIQHGPGEHGAFLLTGAETAGRVTLSSATIDVNAGPPPHVHANEEEFFVVQSGAFELLVNGELVTARAGDVAYMARGEAHRFRGLDSGEPNHFFIIIAPSGFEQFMRRWIPLFEHGAPDMQKAVGLCGEYGISLYPSDDATPPVPAQPETRIIPSGHQPPLSVLGNGVTVLLSAAQTQGRYSLVRVDGPRDSGPPVHIHGREDEMFIIEEGQVEFTLGEEKVIADKGNAVWAPRGWAHTFRIASDYARMVVLMTPGGFEEFFEGCHQMELAGGVEPSAIMALSDRVGMTILPPSQ